MPEPTYARRTARVVLLDGQGRVLLLRFGNDPGEWLTPGGGLDDGEALRQAAVRELWEEVGLAIGVDELGPHVAVASGQVALSWVNGLVRDDFFLHRVSEHQVASPGLTRYERRTYFGHRWWSAAELATTREAVVPHRLGPLVTRLAAGQVPTRPVRLPWHR